jgi:hypothetical protein
LAEAVKGESGFSISSGYRLSMKSLAHLKEKSVSVTLPPKDISMYMRVATLRTKSPAAYLHMGLSRPVGLTSVARGF